MRRTLAVLFALAAIALSLAGPALADPALRALLPNGTAAPDFSAIPFDGSQTVNPTMSLSDYQGKIVVLDFFATWCVPCNKAMAGDQDLVDKYGTDIVFLALCVWDTQTKLSQWLQVNNHTFTFAFDTSGKGPGSVSDEYQVSAIPTTYVLDQSGNIAAGGIAMSEDDMEAAIRKLGALTQAEHAAIAQEQPQAGEIILTGSVSKDYTGSGTLVMSTVSLQYNGVTTKYPTPVTNSVLITPNTLQYGPDHKPIPVPNLSAGTQIYAVGPNPGNGNLLTAREIVLGTSSN